MSYQPTSSIAPFLPVNRTYSEDDSQFLIQITSDYSTIAKAVNVREISNFPLQEIAAGQNFYFPNPQQPRQTFRMTVNFGALPNAGTKSVAHGISFTSTFSVTKIYGAASDQSGLNYIPLPYASPTLANNVELSLNATNVTITTGSNRSNFTVCYIIIEYLKN